MNAAIEAAARAKLRWNFPGLSDADIDEMWPDHVEEMRAAISAFLRNCEVSVEMVECGLGAYDDCGIANTIGGFYGEASQFKEMAKQLATELDGK